MLLLAGWLDLQKTPPSEGSGAACGNRTHDLFITSESLWPTELRRQHRHGQEG
jgi:hypothetical protein